MKEILIIIPILCSIISIIFIICGMAMLKKDENKLKKNADNNASKDTDNSNTERDSKH